VSNLGSTGITHKGLSAVLLVICVQGVVERWRQFERGINESSIIVGSESLTDICLHFDKYKNLYSNTIWQPKTAHPILVLFKFTQISVQGRVCLYFQGALTV